MSITPDDYVCASDLAAAAREFIRGEGGCVVSSWQLLNEASDKFGDRFPVSPDTREVLDLIETLWSDAHVDQVPHGCIEFAWDEAGFDEGPVTGFKALLRRFQILPVPADEA